MADKDSQNYRHRKGPAGIGVNGLMDVIGDRLLACEKRPRLESHEQEDDAEQRRNQRREIPTRAPHKSSSGAVRPCDVASAPPALATPRLPSELLAVVPTEGIEPP